MPMDRLGRTEKLLVASCLASAALFLFVSIATVVYPRDLDLYESNLFVPAERIALGQPIYGPSVVLSEPFIYATYGPVYYLFVGLLLRLTGLAFWPGRLLSLLATIATALVIYRTIERDDSNKMSAFVGATLFIMMPSTWAFGALQRVDALAAFFSALAISISLRAIGRLRFIVAGAACTLAVLTKPTIVAGGAAILIWLVLTGRLQQLVMFSIGAVGVLTIAVIAMILTGNENYLFNLQNAQLPSLLRYLVVNVRGLVQSQVVFACLVIAVIWFSRARLAPLDSSVTLLFVYLLFGGVIGLVTSARTGASINYFYEFTTALALVAGFGFSKFASGDLPLPRAAACVLIAMAIVTELMLFRTASVRGRFISLRLKEPFQAMVARDIETFVPRSEPIVSDYQDLILRTGHNLYFNDWTMYRVGSTAMQTCLRSYLDEKKLGALITNGETKIPGYRLVDGYGYSDPDSTSRMYSTGPLLYLREDLWQKRAALINSMPATR
jgi:hypothetical protein